MPEQQGYILPLQSQVPLVEQMQLFASREEEIYNKCGSLTLLARERHKLHTNNVNYSYIFALPSIALRATFCCIIATQKSSF